VRHNSDAATLTSFRRRSDILLRLGPGPSADMAGKCGLSQDLAAAFSCIAEFVSGVQR